MSNMHIYTVGWICAITTEYVAACVLLDEVHPGLESKDPNDNNTYRLGKMGKHNVVVASLPKGEYGTSSAATVAKDMMRTFPNIKIGLMVGIGGGAPTAERDIRLGDIVVSSPGNGSGGVYQYDFGKAEQDRKFLPTGHLNQTPSLLRTAVADLDVEYQINGHQIEEAINSILKQKPRLRKSYGSPGFDEDRLYKSDFVHQTKPASLPHKNSNCVEVCGNDELNLILRLKRDENDNDPSIHYGTIASANTLMKDAVLRDQLANEKDILCFEMEAAGLMNHFPCLVIRGVCDYADSHKNKIWQGFAAMTAAAYAKDLLQRIAPSEVEAERKISEVLAPIVEKMDKLNHQTEKIDVGLENSRADYLNDKLRTWLSPPDPSTNLHAAIARHHPGTGQWFIDRKEYTDWQTERNSFLWLYGMPGSGKTVLSSTVIENLMNIKKPSPRTLTDDERLGSKRALDPQNAVPFQNPAKRQKSYVYQNIERYEVQSSSADRQSYTNLNQSIVLYFYFDFSDTSKQLLHDALRSLMFQLYYHAESARKDLMSLYATCEKGHRQPSVQSLCETFERMVETAGEVYIVLDALDECSARNEQQATVGLISWLQSLRSATTLNIHLLVTSRPEQDIQAAMDELIDKPRHIPIQDKSITDDIRSYVHTMIKEDTDFGRWQSRQDVQARIEAVLTEKAGGMFRWVYCQLDLLKDCLDEPALDIALTMLPKTLDETYARILENVPQSCIDRTLRILQFLSYSKRPLRLEEMVDVIAVLPQSEPHFKLTDRMPKPREISRYCTSLVAVIEDPESNHLSQLQLSHFSVKEYLTSDRVHSPFAKSFEEHNANTIIANISLAYLHTLDYKASVYYLQQRYPLAEYCAKYWTVHVAAVAEHEDQILQSLVTKFFLSINTYSTCVRLQDPESPYGGADDDRKPVPPLCYASLCGLTSAVHMLLEHGADVNAQGGHYGNALQVAARSGSSVVVEMLLKHGADASAQGGYYGSALQAAAYNGNGEVVKMLLKHGAEVNAQGAEYGNALQGAAFDGNGELIEILLKHGADVNAQGGHYGSALQAAAYNGNGEVVKMLLKHGADINARGGYYGNALQVAARSGSSVVVEMLLKHGADASAQGGYYGNALQAAASEGNGKVVEILLKHGAEVNAQGGYYGNALQAAANNGNGEIVEMLLKHGAEVNAPGGVYGNALQAAAAGGEDSNGEIVTMLLEYGALHDR